MNGQNLQKLSLVKEIKIAAEKDTTTKHNSFKDRRIGRNKCMFKYDVM